MGNSSDEGISDTDPSETKVDPRLLQSFKRYLSLSWDNFDDFRVEMQIIEEEFSRDTLGMPEDEKMNYGIFHVFKKPFDYHRIDVDSMECLLNNELSKSTFPLLKDSKWYGSMETEGYKMYDFLTVSYFQRNLINRILVLNSLNIKNKVKTNFWSSTLPDDSDYQKLLPEICNQKFYYFNRFGSDRSCEIYFSSLNPIELLKQWRPHNTSEIFPDERDLNSGDTDYWIYSQFRSWISSIFQKVLEMRNEKQADQKLNIAQFGRRSPKQYYVNMENNFYTRECSEENDDSNTVLFPVELDRCVDSIRNGPHLMVIHQVQRDGELNYQGIFSIEGKTDTNFRKVSKTYFKKLKNGSEVKYEKLNYDGNDSSDEDDERKFHLSGDDESDYYPSDDEYSPLERFKSYVREGTLYARLEAFPFFILTNKEDFFLFQARKFKELSTGSVEDAIKGGLFDEWDVSYTSLKKSKVPWVMNLTSAFLDLYDYTKRGLKLEKSVLRNYYLTNGASELKKRIDKLKYQVTRKAFLGIFQKMIGDENNRILDIEQFEIPHDLAHIEDEIKISLDSFVEKSKPIWEAGVTNKFLFKTKLSTTFKLKSFLLNELWHTEQAAVVMVAVSGLVTAVLKLYNPVRTTCSKKYPYTLKDDVWATYPSFGRNLKVMIMYYFMNEVLAYKALSGTDYIPRLIHAGYVYMNEVGDTGNIDLYEDPFRIGDGKLENVKADCPFIFIEEIKSIPVDELNDVDRENLKRQAFSDLEDMHSKGIYHRDIDTRNLIIKKINGRTRGLKYRLIFIDFGDSCKMILKKHATVSKQKLFDEDSKYLAETDKSDLTTALDKLFKDNQK